jgi:hypothetical protein
MAGEIVVARIQSWSRRAKVDDTRSIRSFLGGWAAFSSYTVCLTLAKNQR